MITGPSLFCRFAFPPNRLGLCGPSENGLLGELLDAGAAAADEMRHLVAAFDGAWPYLQLISTATGRDPLDASVVEAYWLGSPLLDQVDAQAMGHSITDRFRSRAGGDWPVVAGILGAPVRPTHSFHVFCVYPWVGLLRSGAVDQALEVLDRCRIRWGTVIGRDEGHLLVSTRLLSWDGHLLQLGMDTQERVQAPLDDREIEVGSQVAMHWDYACQRITDSQRRYLQRYQALHLSLANRASRSLAAKVEG